MAKENKEWFMAYRIMAFKPLRNSIFQVYWGQRRCWLMPGALKWKFVWFTSVDRAVKYIKRMKVPLDTRTFIQGPRGGKYCPYTGNKV